VAGFDVKSQTKSLIALFNTGILDLGENGLPRENGAKIPIIIGAVILILGIVLVALPAALPAMAGGGGEGRLEARVHSIDSFMTAVYKVYGNPSLGYWVAKTVIKNSGNGPLYDVRILIRLRV